MQFLVTEFHYPSWTESLKLLSKLNMSSRHASLASQDRLKKSAAMLGLSCLTNPQIPFLESISRPQNGIRVQPGSHHSIKGPNRHGCIDLDVTNYFHSKCILNRMEIWVQWFGFELLEMQHAAIMLRFTAFIHAATPLLWPVIATAPSVHMATQFFNQGQLLLKKKMDPTIWIFPRLLFPPCTSLQKKKKIMYRISSFYGYKKIKLEKCSYCFWVIQMNCNLIACPQSV